MPYGEEPTGQANRGQLAAKLRQQRENAQLSIEELASRIGITPADVEAIEGGTQPTARQLVYGWLNACGMLGPERRAIMDLAGKPAAR
ncbi:MAG: helix-turn-helix domain-containing protein [Hamadaea sp.]|uniref:helix-turn-helix domain-containing protein n=1 Tax=Hamadaea sp. TaxID=2024425 RepID=UPI00178ECC49|nr:helix-turn-helix domain-containing protein [Hamadaea sp.]NUR72439.1 helix-turn-helix domain-containing protein [Hamadaea sp.]NUT19964.1 helix-turn-helix domain-containing protein [Hamadaea sp.]